MSYILDALKKSEQERKLGHLPDLSSDHLPLHRQESTPLVIKLSFMIGLLLVSLLLVIIYFYFTNNTPTDKQPSEKITSFEMPKVQNPKHLDLTDLKEEGFNEDGTSHFRERPLVTKNEMEVIHPSKTRREQLIQQKQTEQNQDAALKKKYEHYFNATDEIIPETLQDKAQQESFRDGAKRRMQETLNSSNQVVEKSPEQAIRNDSEGGSTSPADLNTDEASNPETMDDNGEEKIYWEDYHSIAELSTDIQKQLPSLHVSTHIFSSAESFRKVTINDQSVKKGAEISEELLLQDITEEGVILSFKDVWFRMKALESWQK